MNIKNENKLIKIKSLLSSKTRKTLREINKFGDELWKKELYTQLDLCKDCVTKITDKEDVINLLNKKVELNLDDLFFVKGYCQKCKCLKEDVVNIHNMAYSPLSYALNNMEKSKAQKILDEDYKILNTFSTLGELIELSEDVIKYDSSGCVDFNYDYNNNEYKHQEFSSLIPTSKIVDPIMSNILLNKAIRNSIFLLNEENKNKYCIGINDYNINISYQYLTSFAYHFNDKTKYKIFKEKLFDELKRLEYENRNLERRFDYKYLSSNNLPTFTKEYALFIIQKYTDSREDQLYYGKIIETNIKDKILLLKDDIISKDNEPFLLMFLCLLEHVSSTSIMICDFNNPDKFNKRANNGNNVLILDGFLFDGSYLLNKVNRDIITSIVRQARMAGNYFITMSCSDN